MTETKPNTQLLTDLEGSSLGIAEKLEIMERFIARRFDEISMEINATSQQLDMTEEGLGQKFGEILQIMSAISFQGEGLTQANTGVELKAVIDDTEAAANKILDAADRIGEKVNNEAAWENADTRKEYLTALQDDVQHILMACTFQDLAGQRIRNTLDNLQLIEERLGATLERLGIKPDVRLTGQKAAEALGGTKAQSQDDIDALFS